MVFGGVKEETIQLNEETFWSGWECSDYDDPKTYEHLDEMRRLIFEGRYTEAQKLCDRYFVCRGEGHHDVNGAFGSYQTAGELYITLPEGSDGDYCRELILDEGLVRTSCGNSVREYFVSPAYNTAVIRIRGNIDNAKIRYARQYGTIIQTDDEISAVGYLPTKFAVLIRSRICDGAMDLYTPLLRSCKVEPGRER